MKRVLLALAVAVFLLGACGGDDGDSGSGDSASVEKVKASLTDSSEDGFGMADDDAQCVAEKVVDSFGTDRVNEIDFEAETPAFEGDEPAQATDAFDECLALNEFLVTLFTSDVEIADESASCLTDAIDEADARTFLEETFTAPGVPSDDSIAKLDEDLQSCLTAEEYDDFASS